MPGFILQEEVEDLVYDFTPYGPKGTIPEPSFVQMQNFRSALSDIVNDMLPDDMPDEAPEKPSEMRRLLIQTLGRDQTEQSEKILHAIADLCSSNPSFDVLKELPGRHQIAFTGWISGIFLVPQTLTPATNG